MADKSFEERVQEELGPLKMRPDAEIWTRVEAGIRKENKRRWLLWLFLFAALAGSAVGGYVLTHGGSERETSKQEISKEEGGRQETGKQETGKQETGKQATSKQATSKQEAYKRDRNKEESNRHEAGGKKAPENYRRSVVRQGEKNQEVDLPFTNKQEVNKLPAEPTSETKQGVKTFVLAAPSPSSIRGGTESSLDAKVNKAASTAAIENSSEKRTPPPVEAKPDILLYPSTDTFSAGKAQLVKVKAKKKWELSVSSEVGSSSIRNSLFSGSLQKDNSNGPQNGVGGPGSGGGGNFSLVTPSLKSAVAFGVRLEARRQLDKTFAIAFSAGYSLLQTRTTVGRRIDSTMFFSAFNSYSQNGFYYSNGESANYTNRYNYLQLGTELYTSFQLFKNISARWKLGGGVNWLVASNGIHYDENTGRSFLNNDLLTRVQPYLTTGIDFAIGKNPFVYIGPHWQYNAGHLTKQATSGSHFFISAVQLTFPLSKNKK